LSEDIVDRVLASGFGAPYPSITETYFFNLFRSHAVSTDMINPILWPKQLIDQHRVESTMVSNYRQVGVRVNVMLEPISNRETDWSELPPNMLARADRVIR
jgi:hypothetical protein